MIRARPRGFEEAWDDMAAQKLHNSGLNLAGSELEGACLAAVVKYRGRGVVDHFVPVI